VTIDLNFRRLNYSGERERSAGMYPGEDAASQDLDALLKVETREDAVKFLDEYSPLYSGFDMYFTRPSRMDEKHLNPMVGDVLNTVMMMHVVLDAYRLLGEGVTADGLRRLGFMVEYSEEYKSEDDTPHSLITGEYWFVNRVMCRYIFEFDEAAGHAFAGEKVASYDKDGKVCPIWVIETQADERGQTPETYAQALTNFLDGILTHMLQGVHIVSNKLGFDFAAYDYSAFMWYEFFNRLTKGEIRTCQACGKMFVANLGASNERGGKKNIKSSCSGTCKTSASKARTAIKYMQRGIAMAEAAKTAKIKLERLQRYIELHPDELDD